MADNTEFHLTVNSNAIAELLRSPAVVEDLARRAEAIAATANAHGLHVTRSEVNYNGRARAAVITADGHAIRAEAKDHNLTRALGGGRG